MMGKPASVTLSPGQQAEIRNVVRCMTAYARRYGPCRTRDCEKCESSFGDCLKDALKRAQAAGLEL